MAKQCIKCGKKLSLFAKDGICSECSKGIKNEIKEMKVQVVQAGYLQDRHLELLKMVDKSDAIKLYEQLLDKFQADKELDDREIETLQKLQAAASLSNAEIKYTDKVLPYLYAAAIRKDGKLPTPEIVLPDGGKIILKKDEAAHFVTAAVLKEIRSVVTGYSGGSRGVSLRIMKGMSYRVGAYRGHLEREDRWIEVSRGLLILTNKRLLLSAAPGLKAVNIPLDKIFSFIDTCISNNLF